MTGKCTENAVVCRCPLNRTGRIEWFGKIPNIVSSLIFASVLNLTSSHSLMCTSRDTLAACVADCNNYDWYIFQLLLWCLTLVLIPGIVTCIFPSKHTTLFGHWSLAKTALPLSCWLKRSVFFLPLESLVGNLINIASDTVTPAHMLLCDISQR